MQQIYRRAPMPKCDFNKAALQLWHGFSTVNLLHIFRITFPKNTQERLLLFMTYFISNISMHSKLVVQEFQEKHIETDPPYLLNQKKSKVDGLTNQRIFDRSSQSDVLCKICVVKFWQNSQENTCTGDIFKIKLQAVDLQLYSKRGSCVGVYL